MSRPRGIELHVVSSRLRVHSDPRLLEQMVRNLLANALKYTTHGRVLLGCRRHGSVSPSKCGTPASAVLEAHRPGGVACRLIDAYLPGMSGLELLKQLTDEGHMLPAISITGRGAVSMAVEAMKGGGLGLHREAGRPRRAALRRRMGLGVGARAE